METTQLTQTLKGKIATGNEQLEELKRVAKVFNEIATSNAEAAEASKVHNNGITHSNHTLTSDVEEALDPRVGSIPTPKETAAPIPRVEEEPRMIVACSKETDCDGSISQSPAIISQEIEEPEEPIRPTYQTRSRTQIGSLTQETLLTTIEMSTTKVSNRSLDTRKFPLKLLCERAGAIMDKNGEMLEYRHFIRRPEYREVWGKLYGNEIGRLAQGMKGRAEGTNTMFFH